MKNAIQSSIRLSILRVGAGAVAIFVLAFLLAQNANANSAATQAPTKPPTKPATNKKPPVLTFYHVPQQAGENPGFAFEFSEPLNPTSVIGTGNLRTVRVYQKGSGQNSMKLLPFRVVSDPEDRRLIFVYWDQNVALDPSATYVVELTSGIQSAQGAYSAQNYQFEFQASSNAKAQASVNDMVVSWRHCNSSENAQTHGFEIGYRNVSKNPRGGSYEIIHRVPGATVGSIAPVGKEKAYAFDSAHPQQVNRVDTFAISVRACHYRNGNSNDRVCGSFASPELTGCRFNQARSLIGCNKLPIQVTKPVCL